MNKQFLLVLASFPLAGATAPSLATIYNAYKQYKMALSAVFNDLASAQQSLTEAERNLLITLHNTAKSHIIFPEDLIPLLENLEKRTNTYESNNAKAFENFHHGLLTLKDDYLQAHFLPGNNPWNTEVEQVFSNRLSDVNPWRLRA